MIARTMAIENCVQKGQELPKGNVACVKSMMANEGAWQLRNGTLPVAPTFHIIYDSINFQCHPCAHEGCESLCQFRTNGPHLHTTACT